MNNIFTSTNDDPPMAIEGENIPINLDTNLEEALQLANRVTFSDVNAVNVFLVNLALRYHYINDEEMDDILDQVYSIIFIDAVREGNREVIEHLINIDPTIVITIDRNAQTVLHHIVNATWNSIVIMENLNWFLGYVPDDAMLDFINHEDDAGATVLYLLAYRRFFVDTNRYDGAIDLLIENGADVGVGVRSPLFQNEFVTVRSLLGIDNNEEDAVAVSGDSGDEAEEEEESSHVVNSKRKKYVDDGGVIKYNRGPNDEPDGEGGGPSVRGLGANKQVVINPKASIKNTPDNAPNKKDDSQDQIMINGAEVNGFMAYNYLAISILIIPSIVCLYNDPYDLIDISYESSFQIPSLIGNVDFVDLSGVF